MPFSSLDPQTESSINLQIRCQLSDEQLSFLDSPVAPGLLNLLIAVAGSGKSTTIAAKVASMMLDPATSQIMCMTSTRSASSTLLAKISEAVAKCGLDKEGYAFPSTNVRTIHSVALWGNRCVGKLEIITNVKSMLLQVLDDFLDPYYVLASGAKCWGGFWAHARQDPSMLQYTDQVDETKLGEFGAGKACFKLTLDDASTKEILAAAGFLEGDIDSLASRLLTTRTEILNRLVSFESAGAPYAGILLQLDALMEEKGVADHSKSIKSFAESKQPVAEKGDVLVVDEAQDCTRAQVAIVLTALQAGASVFFVGDPSQGILRFAGSESDPMRSMLGLAEESGVNTTVYKLTTNFRSTNKIVRCSESVLPRTDLLLRGKIRALDEGSPVRLFECDGRGEEVKLIAIDVKKALDSGVPAGEIAITRFKNYSFESMIALSLRKAQVPFVILGTPADTASPPARMLSFLRACIGLETFEDQVADQALLLQAAVRSIERATMPDDVRKTVVTVCSQRCCSVVDAFMNKKQMEAALLKVFPHTFAPGKRTLLGEKVPNPHTKLINMHKSIAAFKAAFSIANRWIDQALKGEAPAGIAYNDFMPPCSSVLATTVTALYTEFLKVKVDRVGELTDLLGALDGLGADSSFSDFVGAVDKEWARITSSKLDEMVVLSTFHKFKGKERSRVYCTELTEKFDYCAPSRNMLATLDATHEADCSVPRTLLCSCPRFVLAKKAMSKEMHIERMRLCHVALSRAKKEMVVSFSGIPSTIAKPAMRQSPCSLAS